MNHPIEEIQAMRNSKDSLGKPKKHLLVALYVSILAVGLGFLLVGGKYFRVERKTEAQGYATAETTDNQDRHPLTGEATAGSALHDGPREKSRQTGVVNAALVETEQDKVYVCPMNCVLPMEKAGRCPVCGMDLVEVLAEEHGDSEVPPRIRLSEDTVRTAGIRVAPVQQRFVSAEIRLFGKIEYDPIEQYKVSAFAPGVIDNIYIRRAGQAVRKGDPLFDLHSSELFFLEEEFFETLKELPYEIDLRPGKYHSRKRVGRWTRLLLPRKGSKDGGMDEAERKAFMQKLDSISRKMRLLGVAEKDIESLIVKGRPTGIATITTPMTGIVLEQNAFRGAYVNTGDVVFTIANPRVLWARLDAYATDFPWIRLGQKAEFETDAYPGQTFAGKVVYIDPEFDPEARVFKVGVLYNDSKGLLKPNMIVRALIAAEMTSGGQTATELLTRGMMGTAQTKRTNRAPLVIPESAPLITGKRAIVYVAVPESPGTYEGREIKLGPKAKGYYLVREGLQKDEMVVVNGNFKIDSAVQILAKPSMMEPEGGKLAAGHHHHGGLDTKTLEHEAMNPVGQQPGKDRHTHDASKPMLMESAAGKAVSDESKHDPNQPMPAQMESDKSVAGHEHGAKPESTQVEPKESEQPRKGAQWEMYR